MLPIWDESISVHDDAIDAQHKKLFEIAKRAYAFSHKSADKKEIIIILKELLDYTQQHFRDEEAYMESFNFPQLENHKEKHRAIVQEMITIAKTIKNLEDFKKQIIIITKRWLLEHILQDDMEYAKFKQNTCPIHYDTPPDQKKSSQTQSNEKVKYRCDCKGKVHLVSKETHQKIQSKQTSFSCKTCKKTIQPMG